MTRVVVVTGAGRSGTSSVAGSLKRLGLHIPQPEKAADEWNPRGYYESSWPTAFHARWLKPLMRDMDARPHGAQIALDSLTEEQEQRFTAWLHDQVGQRAPDEVILVKETRAFWVLPLWERAAAAAGAELATLTMVRHPAQVVRSRDTKHQSGRPDEVRTQRETLNVAGWLNSLFTTERVTRHLPRTFVLYDELVGDWRAALGRAGAQLDLDLGDLDAPHAVDDFLDASLSHSAPTWDGLEVGDALVDLAERTWEAAHRLVEDPSSEASTTRLADLGREYDAFYRMSAAVVEDDRQQWIREIRSEFVERLDAKDARLASLRHRVRRLQEDATRHRPEEAAEEPGRSTLGRAARRALGRRD